MPIKDRLTDSEIKKIVSLYKSGLSAPEVAKRSGRCLRSVYQSLEYSGEKARTSIHKVIDGWKVCHGCGLSKPESMYPQGKAAGNRCKKCTSEERSVHLKKNPSARFAANLRSRLHIALRVSMLRKSNHTLKLLGCSIIELLSHLRDQFEPGMTFENYGKAGWHVDHIKPCSSFDLNDPKQQKKCFHWSNLQPLWAEENYSKSDKV
jgi:hypothetical protein